MGRLGLGAMIALLAVVPACGKKKDNTRTAEGSKPLPGADSPEAAAKQLVDGLAAGDLAVVKRVVPDAEACKLLKDLPQCDAIQKRVDESWEKAKPLMKAFAGATPVKASEPSPFPNSVLWKAESKASGAKQPLVIITVEAAGRHYAAFKLPDELKPPSTGNEMPGAVAMTPAQAQKAVADTMALAAKPDADCNKIADELTAALPVAFPASTKDAVPALKALFKCSIATKRWRSALQAGGALLPFEGDKYTVAQIVRALVEMGEYDRAIAVAQELAKKFPAAEESLVGATVFALCKAEAWDKCVKAAEGAYEHFVKAGGDPKSEGVMINRLFRNMAWVVTGKPKEALADFDEIQKIVGELPKSLEGVKIEAQQAIQRGFYLEVVPMPQLPTGIYHLMGRQETGALVTLKLFEHQGKQRTLRVEAEIPGVTDRSSNTLMLGPKQHHVQYVNPTMKMDFDATKIRSPRPAQLAIKISEEDAGTAKVLYEETLQVSVLPRDYLPLKRLVGADSAKPTFGYMGAWITSNDPAIETFLTTAKQLTPTKAFVGEQDVTVPQVKALFDALKAKGVSYVMDPSVTSTQNFVQRTRLPAEVLASTNAQCLEGTLLFASLMEAIGVKPIIVVVPGHAFVGWKTVPKDGTKGEPLFVETTMISGFTFEQAVKVATERVTRELKTGAFKSGASTLIDVTELRAKGFIAQSL